MLILTRKNDEEIIINSDIRIKIISITDGQVKIGIDAPKEIEILRGELYQKVKEVTKIASEASSNTLADISKLKVNKLGKKVDSAPGETK